MNANEPRRALRAAVTAARTAGALMQRHRLSAKHINEATQFDLKLELDVRCQQTIERALGRAYPRVPVLGEEGVSGDHSADTRWVVDPIDGTVNFAYAIPHACVSIAFQARRELVAKHRRHRAVTADGFVTLAGVVYDPFVEECWTGVRGEAARCNGKIIRVSTRKNVAECMVAIGFAKREVTLKPMQRVFNALLPRVRKIRIMGAAALAMSYVASGRFDAYWEAGLRLWDIAAAGLIVECAGGEFWNTPVPGEPHTYGILANNGRIRRTLEKFVG